MDSAQNATYKKLSYEYIRGLVEGEGCFTFSPVGYRGGLKRNLPAFVLSMSRRDKDLIEKVKTALNLRNKVYEYKPRIRKDGYKRDGMAVLIVRDIGQLKNIIVPLFYKKLNGYKAKQFDEWIIKIGDDPEVPDSYKLITKIYKSGFYDRNLTSFV
jgi:hypothetical protein